LRVRTRFPIVLALVLGLFLTLPVTGLPGSGPRPVPTRVQTLDLAEVGLSTGQGMGPAQPTASKTEVIETEPFGLVGLSWDTPPPAGSQVKVRVRQGDGWTSWLPIPWHDDHGPDTGTTEAQQVRQGSDPMLTGESDAVQVWVQSPDGQAPGNAQVHLVDTDDVGIQQSGLAQASAAPGMPPIITRAQWGADESQRNRDPIYCDAVKVGFVHHTVSSSTYTPEEAAAQVRNLYAWYTEGLKYSDMAYNYLIDRFGRLYEGRYGGLDKCVVGGHTAGLNTNSFAVSAMGNFDEYNPPDAQMDTMKESIAQLMAWKLGLTKRDPAGKDSLISNGSLGSGYWEAGQTATINRVSGHRDAGNTACPGQYLYAHVGEIRARASEIYKNGGGGGSAGTEIPDLIEPNPVTKEFNFRGSGNGDGVGVPKAGVLGQARDGKKATGILRHYLKGVTVAKTSDTKLLKVNLGAVKQAVLDSRALSRGGGAFKAATVTGTAKTVLRATANGDSVVLSAKQGKKWKPVFTGDSVPVRWAGTRAARKLGSSATSMIVGGDELRGGTVKITAAEGTLRIIASLQVGSEYVPYLETVSRSWPEQAQRAMAIVARSKALTAPYNAECACHVSDAGFLGQKATSAKGYSTWSKAVNSTAGRVVSYNGATVDVPVMDATGGATLNAADVWGQDVAYLRSADDPWSLETKNSSFAAWGQQTREQSAVAGLFGLTDVVRLDLSKRIAGGAVGEAVATSSDGKTASISGEKLRTGLELPSAYIARSVGTAPTSATALSSALSSGRKGSPVVVQASDTPVVALAAAYAGSLGRPLVVVGGSGPGKASAKMLRRSTMTAVGTFSASVLKQLDRLGSVRTVTAEDVPSLSLKLATAAKKSDRRTVFVASPDDPAAMATAAMGAARAGGYLLAVDEAPSQQAATFTKSAGKRTVVLAAKSVISNVEAAQLRKPVRLGTTDPVARSARIAALGPRRGEAILVDATRPMAAAAAAASGQAVLLVDASGAGKALQFIQSSPAISVLRSVGADPAVVTAARRA
jgi:SpoIID/LytB domain protein